MASSSGHYVALADRALIAVTGKDSCDFLQGIVTNDMAAVSADRAVYAALLTPQGKYLHDFFVFRIGDTLYLDCEAARRGDLVRRLSLYKLRAEVTIEESENSADGLAVYALLGDGVWNAVGLAPQAGAATRFGGGAAYADPRTVSLGVRAALPMGPAASVLAEAGFAEAGRETYDGLGIGLGVPDGSRDMILEKSLPLEFGLGDLNGIDFNKGCFIGQEVTARMQRRGLVRKRLMPVDIDGAPPEPGTPVLRGDHEAGEIRVTLDGAGLALLRLDRIAPEGPELTAGGARISPRKPDWADF